MLPSNIIFRNIRDIHLIRGVNNRTIIPIVIWTVSPREDPKSLFYSFILFVVSHHLLHKSPPFPIIVLLWKGLLVKINGIHRTDPTALPAIATIANIGDIYFFIFEWKYIHGAEIFTEPTVDAGHFIDFLYHSHPSFRGSNESMVSVSG